MNALADELLEAHVEHEVARLRGAGLRPLVREHVAAAFAWFEDVKLGDIVTPVQVMGIIDRYVIELRISGGIVELAGQMANVVYSSQASTGTRLVDIMGADTYSEFADKVAALHDVQEALIRGVTRSAAFEALSARVLSRMVVDLVFGNDDDPGSSPIRELVSSLAHKVSPGFEQALVSALSRYVEQHAGRLTRDGARHLLAALDPEGLRQMADDTWDVLSKRRLSEAAAVFTPQDLEDFVVLGFEFWLKFRKTPYFRRVTAEVVSQFFDKYGKESVSTVIQDMGVTERMVEQEIVSLAVPVIEAAHRTGFLAERLRAQLEPFYRSDRVLSLLSR